MKFAWYTSPVWPRYSSCLEKISNCSQIFMHVKCCIWPQMDHYFTPFIWQIPTSTIQSAWNEVKHHSAESRNYKLRKCHLDHKICEKQNNVDNTISPPGPLLLRLRQCTQAFQKAVFLLHTMNIGPHIPETVKYVLALWYPRYINSITQCYISLACALLRL